MYNVLETSPFWSLQLSPALTGPIRFTLPAVCFYTSPQFMCSYTDKKSPRRRIKTASQPFPLFGTTGWGGKLREGRGGLNIGNTFLVVYVAVMMVAGVHSAASASYIKHNFLTPITRKENSPDNRNLVVSETYNTT